ncbi:ABC transporter ATP-binding protein [Dinoroseobacter sp. PD6]|uniref:ABC transporter ATP-binding protein n=1 Tax=Dinoroseobacter sp. PD6 TaxID=3028384 RepID=UPI00237C32A9|nr:ABC transporter ATP-binding protein [Dinoroseobacter sp. PD6]MDD9716629.1 ABC transporter ATP-binding protein [Dinoroseobacter sp. PD6]
MKANAQMDQSSEPIVKFDNVVKRFGSFTAVKKADFEIGRGEFLAIMGSSGCGKTTTLRMLAGLEDPTEGAIYLDGEQVNGKATWDRDTPMVWQSLALFPFLTVQENVEFALKMRGIGKQERRQRADKWLDKMQITEFADRNINQLSGGQKQRVALARALVTEPKILLLDEPLSALDAHLKVRMQSVLSNLQKDLGITFVYVTHSMSEAFSMADRVVIMSRGQIEQIGTPEEIYREPHNRFVAEFLGSANIFDGVVEGPAEDGGWRVSYEGGETVLDKSELAEARKGQAVTFIVSAENMQLSLPDSGQPGIAASVAGEEFIGGTAMVFLETATGQELKVQKTHEELSQLDLHAGSRIIVHWAPDSCHVLPGETGARD